MSYNLLKGKRGIIFGALNEQSIAWKVAEKAVAEGIRDAEISVFHFRCRFGQFRCDRHCCSDDDLRDSVAMKSAGIQECLDSRSRIFLIGLKPEHSGSATVVDTPAMTVPNDYSTQP